MVQSAIRSDLEAALLLVNRNQRYLARASAERVFMSVRRWSGACCAV